MIEIRFHGRGGQGVVMSAVIFAKAAVLDGKYAHAFPFYGPERRGAPVVSFARINNKVIKIREQIYNPDYVVVLDSTLCKFVNIAIGIKSNGKIFINTVEKPEFIIKNLRIANKNVEVFTVDANNIAKRIFGKPIVNTIMLGALAGISNLVTLNSLEEAIKEFFSGDIMKKNLTAIREAYNKYYQKSN
jgi:2-oxoacid:acceptor oxidoreductase gamma subunit (pyruvate/2-ketoisovalerate family)